jgi:hypothetical protein
MKTEYGAEDLAEDMIGIPTNVKSISPQESTKCIFQGKKNSTTPVVNFLRDLATFCNQKQKRQKYREYATGRIIVLEQWATLPS